MGVKSLWALVRTLFPNACAEAWNVSSAIRESTASPSSSSASRPPPKATAPQPTPAPTPAPTTVVKTRLYIDVNALLHRAAYHEHSEDAVIADVKRRVDALVFGLPAPASPSRGRFGSGKGSGSRGGGSDLRGEGGKRFPRQQITAIYIALDGPAPLGKLLMQRTRRLGVAKKRRTTTDSLRFNRLHFTPGSLFMTRLDALLSHYAASVVCRNPWIQECVVSGSRVAGEGETKIVEQVYKAASAGANTDLHLIITGDSDALIHLLLLPPTTRAALFTPDQKLVFTVPPLLEHLRPYFPRQHTQLHRVAQDMSVLILLGFGNDTLPPLRRCRFDSMWSAYREWMSDTNGGRFLVHVQHGHLDLDVLKVILERTQQDLQNSVSGNNNLSPLKHAPAPPPREKLHPSIGFDTKSDSTAAEAWEPPSDSDADAPDLSDDDTDASNPFDEDLEDDDTPIAAGASEDKVTSYIDMLLWVLHSCSRGTTRDFRVAYTNGSVPSPAALRDWIQRRRAVSDAIVCWDDLVLERGALLPALCAVAVIPAEEGGILDAALSPLINEFEAICARNAPAPVPDATLPAPESALNKNELFLKSVEELEARFGDDARVREGFMAPVRARFVQEGVQAFGVKEGVNLVGDVREGLLPIMELGGTPLRYVEGDGTGTAVCFEVWEEGVGWRWVKDAKSGKKEKNEKKGRVAQFRVPSGLPSGLPSGGTRYN
ncbi:hypothetical protein BC830DRAFT_444885 [Chytriomyces sp. MP71]|nr:hypothetical protein BC830DRAFT_444885 [Chytriomyces sp. MP71]